MVTRRAALFIHPRYTLPLQENLTNRKHCFPVVKRVVVESALRRLTIPIRMKVSACDLPLDHSPDQYFT